MPTIGYHFWIAVGSDAALNEHITGERWPPKVEAFRANGGAGKPMALQVYLAYAATEAEARGVQMLFDFYLNNHLFLALARASAEPLRRALGELPPLPADAQWVNWVRNYDELDLQLLADDERMAVFARFAPEERARIYGRGIRRRWPPMVDGDRRRIELAYALMLSLPGAPMLTYGEEIGMGDDLALDGRDPGRAPMQWSARPGPASRPRTPPGFPARSSPAVLTAPSG